MRLYISVNRHKLPSVSLVWKVSTETSDATTIAQFLAQVNAVIPLCDETSSWTVKDYVVSLRGYECLHWQRIIDVMENGDEVRISPLRPSAIKRRVLSGRQQVSADGKALVDGVPYGKPFNQAEEVARPAVHIPPRKRSRATYETEQGELLALAEPDREIRVEQLFEDADLTEDEGRGEGKRKKRRQDDAHTQQSKATGLGTGSSDSEDDAFETAESGSLVDGSDSGSSKLDNDAGSVRHHRSASSDDAASTSSDSSDSSDETSSSESSADSSDSSELSDSDLSDDDTSSDSSEAASDSESDSESEKSSTTSDRLSVPNKSPETSSIVKEKATRIKVVPQAPTSGARNALVEVKSSASQTQHSSTSQSTSIPVPPGQGKPETSRRNQRRKDTKQLEKLKSLNILPPDAGKEELRKWRQEQQSMPVDQNAAMEAKRKRLLDAILDGGVDVTNDSNFSLDAQNAKITDNKPTVNGTGIQDVNTAVYVTPDSGAASATLDAEGSPRRSRIDIASSRRLLFGSLGLRTPKNKAEEQALRDKLKTQGERKPVIKTSMEAVESNGTLDLSAEDEAVLNTDTLWKDKIHLTAVECCDENVHLSTPPFPFYQRWDPQQQQKPHKSKKRKRKNHDEIFEESYVDDALGSAPNLSLAEITHNDSEYNPEVGPEADLPVLPPFPDSLNDLIFDELHNDDIIAFKQLEVSEATGWQPIVSGYRTARVTDVSPSTGCMQVQLARRDWPQRNIEYDDDGRRIYGRFEMPNPDDGENDDKAMSDEDCGMLELDYKELIQPKLLRSALSQSLDKSSGDIIPSSLPAYEHRMIDNHTANKLDTQSQSPVISPTPASQLSAHLPSFDNVQAAQPPSQFLSGVDSTSNSSSNGVIHASA